MSGGLVEIRKGVLAMAEVLEKDYTGTWPATSTLRDVAKEIDLMLEALPEHATECPFMRWPESGSSPT